MSGDSSTLLPIEFAWVVSNLWAAKHYKDIDLGLQDCGLMVLPPDNPTKEDYRAFIIETIKNISVITYKDEVGTVAQASLAFNWRVANKTLNIGLALCYGYSKGAAQLLGNASKIEEFFKIKRDLDLWIEGLYFIHESWSIGSALWKEILATRMHLFRMNKNVYKYASNPYLTRVESRLEP